MSVSSSTPPHLTRRSATKLLGGALLSTLVHSPLTHAQQTEAPAPGLVPTAQQRGPGLPRGDGAQRLSLLHRAGRPIHRPGARPRSQQDLHRRIRFALRLQHRRHRLRPYRALHLRPGEVTSQPTESKNRSSPPWIFTSTRCRTSTASSTTSPMSRPASRSSTAKSRRSTRPSSYAASSPLAPTSTTLISPHSPPQLYNRVDWPWMLNGGKTFSMGWRPETGFISSRWNHYSELMMLYLLAIGSPTHPVSAESWNAFTRPPMTFGPYTYISGKDPLFVHQYSHAWFDFARQRDAYANYFVNSITATRACKAFCLSLNRGYTDDYWGITASDWQHGYTAWGGPPLMGPVDGSVVPCAAAGSLPFLPRGLRPRPPRAPRQLRQRCLGPLRLLRRLPPRPALVRPDVLGIDLGIGLLMAENLRTAFVWETFMQNPEPVAAMKACGFHTTRQDASAEPKTNSPKP